MASCTCSPIGQMNCRVTVERATYAQDSHNEQIPTYSPYIKRWAFARAMSAREAIQAEQLQGAIGWVVELPYDSQTIGITSDMRMTLHGFSNRVVHCDGPAMPVDGGKQTVRVRAVEQTT